MIWSSLQKITQNICHKLMKSIAARCCPVGDGLCRREIGFSWPVNRDLEGWWLPWFTDRGIKSHFKGRQCLLPGDIASASNIPPHGAQLSKPTFFNKRGEAFAIALKSFVRELVAIELLAMVDKALHKILHVTSSYNRRHSISHT